MIIRLEESEVDQQSIRELAMSFIDSTVYVGWPHLSESKVIRVSDSSNVYSRAINGDIVCTNNERWKLDVKTIQEQ